MIDFFLVCDKILPLITSMSIDESGSRSLTKYKGGVVKSDHRVLELNVDMMFHKEIKHERDHVFNVRNKICQNKFFTSHQKKVCSPNVLKIPMKELKYNSTGGNVFSPRHCLPVSEK